MISASAVCYCLVVLGLSLPWWIGARRISGLVMGLLAAAAIVLLALAQMHREAVWVFVLATLVGIACVPRLLKVAENLDKPGRRRHAYPLLMSAAGFAGLIVEAVAQGA